MQVKLLSGIWQSMGVSQGYNWNLRRRGQACNPVNHAWREKQRSCPFLLSLRLKSADLWS